MPSPLETDHPGTALRGGCSTTIEPRRAWLGIDSPLITFEPLFAVVDGEEGHAAIGAQ